MAIASAHSLVWNVAPMRVGAYYCCTCSVRKCTAGARRRVQFASFTSGDSDDSRNCRPSMDGVFQPSQVSATVTQVTKEAIAWLEERHVPEPEASVYQLLASALNLDWNDGYRALQQQHHQQQQRDDPTSIQHRLVTTEELKVLQTMLDRRATMEPIQYILGQWDFLDYTLLVRAPLLCPRPETEELVLHVEQDFKKKYMYDFVTDEENKKDESQQNHRILDIGCGTGAIGISLCHRLGVNVDAIDINPTAVQVSNLNAQRILGVHQASFRTEQCDIANFVSSGYSMVVSNPPYIPRCDMATLEENVVNFEHDSALCGGDDGLDVVREIIRKLPSLCLPGASCWMELDPSHPAMIEALLRDNETVKYHGSYKDMFGNDRFVKLMVS